MSKAVVGVGRTGSSGPQYLNEEVDPGGHGGRRNSVFDPFFFGVPRRTPVTRVMWNGTVWPLSIRQGL